MKKVCYIHGAFSAYKPDSEKVKGLSEAFDVVGVNYSVETPFNENVEMMVEFCLNEKVDFVVGTSLGGLFASEINNRIGLPAVMINPCVEPVMSLSTIVGTQKNFTTGKDETLTMDLVKTYPSMAKVSDSCLIFIGMKDQLINSEKTELLYKDKAPVIRNEEEDHYWEFFKENEIIQKHLSSI